MKSERGITITSIIIYIVALTSIVIIVGRVSTYFYKNVNYVKTNATADAEYTKFNSYFTDDINIEKNTIASYGTNYIIFSKSEHQYTYQNGNIYMNKVKISKDVESFELNYNETTGIISINMQIKGKNYSNTYTVVK